MLHSTPEQLRFPPIAGYTVRADFNGGALSSDFGALLLRGIDRQIGLTERLAAAVQDKRHPSYIVPPLRDLLAQRIGLGQMTVHVFGKKLFPTLHIAFKAKKTRADALKSINHSCSRSLALRPL